MHPLEAQIGYKFRNSLLLAEALTHPSLGHETQQIHFDNQRLEYLGDAVLQLLFSEHLFQRFADAGEGQLTKLRARLVSGETLAQYARKFHLGDYLMIGRGDESSGGRKRTSTLADAFESLVGAMYLDGGIEAVRTFVMEQARDQVASVHHQPPIEVNPKGRLQETLQALPPRSTDLSAPRNPTYTILSHAGPDHARSFKACVLWYGLTLGEGEGSSKQQAESAAAIDALRLQRWLEPVDPAPAVVPGADQGATGSLPNP
jgi:ribonuclease III